MIADDYVSAGVSHWEDVQQIVRQEFVGLLWVIEKGSLEHANLK